MATLNVSGLPNSELLSRTMIGMKCLKLLGGCLLWVRCLYTVAVDISEDEDVERHRGEVSTRLSVECEMRCCIHRAETVSLCD